MELRNFGRTGVPVSVLCLGAMNFGNSAPEDDSIKIVHRALDAGINFVDTANVYSRGISETITGKALKGKRDQVFLATKVHGRMSDNPFDYGNNRKHIIASCEASLKRLDTDYIDLYQIHRPQVDTPIDETLRALDDLITAGKVRYIGTSSYTAWKVVESLWIAKELGFNRFVSEQPPYHLLDRAIERELIPMAQQYGLAIIPWSPLARGFLSGKYERGQEIPADSRFASDSGRSGAFDERLKKHFSDSAYNLMDVVKELADEKGVTPAQIALAWVVQQPGVTSPIIGPRTMAHLEDNLGALEVEFTPEDYDRIDQVSPREEAIVPYYHGKMMEFGPSDYR